MECFALEDDRDLSHLTELPILTELIPEGLPVPAVYLVEFEPSSLWYETSFTLAAHAATHGIKTDYHSFMRSPDEIREAFRKLGVDVDRLEHQGALRLFDSYTVTTGETPENLKWDANRSINLADWKDNPFQGFGSSYGLHIDDNNSVMLEYNDEKAFIDWLRVHDHLAAKSANVLLIHSVVSGVYSPAFYRQAEALASGIIDFRSEEKDDQIQQLVRIRILRGRTHDSRWRRIQLLEDGQVGVVEGKEDTTAVRTVLPATERRRLASIMFTDMIGYTALGQRNESLSLALVNEQRKLIRPILNRHNGREVKTIGDAFLVEFSSALEAARCAYDIQRAIKEFNISLPEDRRLHLRIGVHLGDVLDSEGDVSGDAVNVASRVKDLADDGDVCLTRQVYDHVQNKFELPLKSLGPQSLKNVNTPVEVYKMEMPWDEKRAGQPAELDKRRIAVLPFANMSPDPADEYFADGLTEELISKLSLVKGLRVIARTSVMSYKKKDRRISEIGTELGVGSVVEGSFRKAGNKIRVTTQLIDVRDEQHLWAQSYDRALDDVFAVQTDIAKQVSDALKVKILEAEIDWIDRRPTESTKAYSLYLRGRYHFNRRGVEDIVKASEYFGQAVREDERFALGYVGLADCYAVLSNLGIDSSTNHQKAKIAVAKGLELDRDLAEAHATLGLIHFQEFNLREAEEEFGKAIELKPSYAPAHHWYFRLLLGKLRWDEALKQIEKAVELDPFSQIINLNHAHYYRRRGDYDKALELYKKAVELDPNFAIAHFDLAVTYGRMKRSADMKREAKIAIERGTREAKTAVGLGRVSYHRPVKILDALVAYFEEDKEKVRKLLPELEAHFGEPLAISALQTAGLYFYLGENEKGFKWLEKSYSIKEDDLLYIRTEEFFDGIRHDPRYQNLLKRIGLE